ncbi:MAG: hypothetical protein ACI4R9_00820 [Kiritimatiellia bacterium]
MRRALLTVWLSVACAGAAQAMRVYAGDFHATEMARKALLH